MKKIANILFIVLSIALLSSCRGLPGRDGVDGIDGFGQIKNVVINVPQNAWQYSKAPNNNYFYATVDMPEITKDVFKEGLVKMYRCYALGSEGATKIELPYVRSIEEYIEADDDWAFYTETVDYQYSQGTISIYYTLSDFIYELDESFVPEAMEFQCVIIY